MKWDPSTIIAMITALGVGGVIKAALDWLKDRKKVGVDIERTDVDTKLAYLNTVIERLDQEAKRALSERDRTQAELEAERERSRKRIHELEDEIDSIRKIARETQHKCDELAHRLKRFVDNVNDEQELK